MNRAPRIPFSGNRPAAPSAASASLGPTRPLEASMITRLSRFFRAVTVRGGPLALALFSPAATAQDRKSTRLNSSHIQKSRMPSSA